MDQQAQEERDVALMRRALELAARGPVADPNPRVGAVVLDAAGEVADVTAAVLAAVNARLSS